MRFNACSIICALGLFSANAACVKRSAPAETKAADSGSSLYAEDGVVAFDLRAPYTKIFSRGISKDSKEDSDGLPGTLVWKGATGDVEIPVLVRERGKTSAIECTFHKLTVKIPKEDRVKAAGTPFEGVSKFKLGTHCKKRENLAAGHTWGRLGDERATWRERLAYRFVQALMPVHLRSANAKIQYTDTANPDDATKAELDIAEPKSAFIYEDDSGPLERLGKDDFEKVEESAVSPGAANDPDLKYDPNNLAMLQVLELIVGNSDWEINSGNARIVRVGSGYNLWNVLAYKQKTPKGPYNATAVPYDFDLSYFTIAETIEERGSGQLSESFEGDKPTVHRQLLHTIIASMDSLSATELAKAFQTVNARKAELLQLVDSSPVDAEAKSLLRARLEALDAIVSNGFLDSMRVVSESAKLYKSDRTTPICDLKGPTAFSVKSEKDGWLEIAFAFPSRYIDDDCAPGGNRIDVPEIEGYLRRQDVIGTKAIMATSADKVLPENKRKSKAERRIRVPFYNRSDSKAASISSKDGKVTCAIPPFETLDVEMLFKEFAHSSAPSRVGVLKTAVPNCALTVDAEIVIKVFKDFSVAGG